MLILLLNKAENMTNKDQSPGRDITRRLFLKQSSILGAAAVTGILAPGNGYAAQSDGFPVVETTYGKIRGMNTAGIKTFRGIRYGASTSGANRFMPPVKPARWKDVYDAFAYGPAAPQMPEIQVTPMLILLTGTRM